MIKEERGESYRGEEAKEEMEDDEKGRKTRMDEDEGSGR